MNSLLKMQNAECQDLTVSEVSSFMQLSPECRDLLDSIFVVDEKKRISIQDMKKHAWYNKSLPSRLQHSERHLREEQQRLEAHMTTRQLDEVGASVRHRSYGDARSKEL